MDWLLIACAAGAVISIATAFILGACWLAGKADEQLDRINREIEAERPVRYAEHVPCPWELKQCATPARISGLVGATDAAPRGLK